MLLHWARVELDDDRHANSVWGAPLGDPLDEESLAVSSPGEVEALEQLFAQRQRQRRAREAGEADGDGDGDAGDDGDDAGAGGSAGGGGWKRLRRLVGTKRIALIEAKRAQNVTIALATFEKGLPASAKGDYDALCAVILSRLPRHAMLASGGSPGGGRARERQPRCLGDDPEQCVDGLVHLYGGAELKAQLQASPILEERSDGDHVRIRVGELLAGLMRTRTCRESSWGQGLVTTQPEPQLIARSIILGFLCLLCRSWLVACV